MYKTLWSLYSGRDGDKCKNPRNTYVFYITYILYNKNEDDKRFGENNTESTGRLKMLRMRRQKRSLNFKLGSPCQSH